MSLNDKVFIKLPGLVARKVGNDYIIVPVSDNIANMNALYTLNETGAFIWEQIDGVKTVKDIVNLVFDEFDSDLLTTNNDIDKFINEINNILITEYLM